MPLIPWLGDKKPPKNEPDFITTLKSQTKDVPAPVLALSVFALGGISTVGGFLVYKRYFRRLRNSEWVTPDILAKRKWIKGVVTSVGDADNFRLYHTPGFGWRYPLKFRRVPTTTKDLRFQTIHIRIAGVDAPEAAHFGRPAQPYSAEALAWLKSRVEGRRVWCQLVRRDQYGRIVSTVEERGWTPWSKNNLSLAMLRSGWVTTYEQGGAEYGAHTKEEFLSVQEEAQKARKGIWAEGLGGETPAEYKKKHAAAEAAGGKGEVISKGKGDVKKLAERNVKKSWIGRLLGLK